MSVPFPKPNLQKALSAAWLPLLLAVVAFLVYWPSLSSDFVYDAREEILREGFITSLSNLPAVLSLKVLGTHLILAARPGQLLYMMLIAAVCGKEPWGYHLCSNLVHAVNVALLFVLLRRLMATEIAGLTGKGVLKAQLAAGAVTLIFALHPLAVEPVSEVNYSSDLLVTFFTLLALLAATAFRPENVRTAMIAGAIGTLCAFAAVTCKESGVAVALVLIVYWFLFRRNEAKGPWLLFLGAATVATTAFLVARFALAPFDPHPLSYLGGSFAQVFLIQPQLWVFMMGKLFWPVQLSADYTLENMGGLSTPLALAILVMVLLLQAWLAAKSRVGALGVALYWLGLATVSNFIPLNRILADRFYYLPLAGVAMQLLALLLMTLKSRWGFWMAVAPCLVALPLLTLLTLNREEVFASDFSLWTDTAQVSPFSKTAQNDLGIEFVQRGRLDEALVQFQKALEIDPNFAAAYNNLGNLAFNKGRLAEAIARYQKALEINPDYDSAHYNLGNALNKKGQEDEALTQFQKAVAIDPYYIDARYNLGHSLLHAGRYSEAIEQYEQVLKVQPDYPKAHNNLAIALVRMGRIPEAIEQFKAELQLYPDDADTRGNLVKVEKLQKPIPVTP